MISPAICILKNQKGGPMAYLDAFSVDDLVNQKTRFVNKIVVLSGKLIKYEMGPGLLTWPLELTIKGEEWQIVVGCKISRAQGEHKVLQPHLDAFLGETIGVKVFADNRTITAMKFGEEEFAVKMS